VRGFCLRGVPPQRILFVLTLTPRRRDRMPKNRLFKRPRRMGAMPKTARLKDALDRYWGLEPGENNAEVREPQRTLFAAQLKRRAGLKLQNDPLVCASLLRLVSAGSTTFLAQLHENDDPRPRVVAATCWTNWASGPGQNAL